MERRGKDRAFIAHSGSWELQGLALEGQQWEMCKWADVSGGDPCIALLVIGHPNQVAEF
jgi:hypothetical protein